MSYWDIVGDGTDLAGGQDSSGQILESLIASGIPPAEAERIASAFAQVYATQAALQGLLNAALKGKPSTQAQPPATQTQQPAAEKPGLEVGENADFRGNVRVGGNLSVNNLQVFNNAAVGRRIDGTEGNFRSIVIPGGARLGGGAAFIDAPLVANRPILSRQGGRFAGDNTFDGRVNLAGQVVWNNRLCQPANVVLTKSLNASGNNKLRVGTQEVYVLRDHGNGPGQGLEWTYEPDEIAVVTGVSTTPQTTSLNNYSLSEASVNCVTSVSTQSVEWTNYTLAEASVNAVTQVQTAPITVITSVGFNAESCAVTSETTTVYSVVSVSSGSFQAATFTGSESKTAIGTVTANTGPFYAATYPSPPTTVNALTSVVINTGTADVADLTGSVKITATP